MKNLILYTIAIQTLLLQNVHCIDNNNANSPIEVIESCNFDDKYLQDVLQYSNRILYSNKSNKYCIVDEQNQQFIIFQKQQLLNIFEEILTNTYSNILNTPNLESKLSVAEPFYRMVYHRQKLSFILNNNDLNIFQTIDNIVNKIKPFCEEHAVANLGPKSILYGMDILEGTLPTINNQFISGLNFQIDFTKSYSRNKKDFKTYYDKILINVPSIQRCINVKLLNELIVTTNRYINTVDYFKKLVNTNNNEQISQLVSIIDNRISIVNNLNNFFIINGKSILTNVNQILVNRTNLFNEAWDTQIEEVNINELLYKFFEKLNHIDDLQVDEKTDVYHDFFNNLCVNKTIRDKILLINNTKIINKLNNFLKRADVRKFNTNYTFEIQKKNTWNSIRITNSNVMDKKLEAYHEMITMFCNNCIQTKINPVIEDIKKNNSDLITIKELKNTILEYLEEIKNYMINETKKYEIFCNNKQSLVPINFWKQKTIDYKLFIK